MITGSEQCGSQHSSQSSDSGEPLSSGEEWQLALSRKTRGMIRQAVQSSEAVERRPPQAKSTVASTFTLPVSSSPSSVVVPTEHISSSSCIRKMYEREKLVVTSEGKTGSLPALTLKDFVLPPIDDELMEEDDSGYFWSLCVPSSSRSRTRSFHVLSISDDDVVSLHEGEFEYDEPVFTIPEGGCYMDSGDESEGTPQPLLVEATQAMTLEPNESPDEFDSVQEIQPPTAQSPVIPASVVQGPRQPPAQGPIRPLVQGPSQVCIEADVSAADHVRSPFQFAVGHDVPPSRGRGWRGRGRSRDSDCPARNLYSRVPPPNLHPFPLTVESDSDDEMIDIIHHPTPSQSLSFADYNAFPTVRRHLIPEGGLVIDGGSDDDADVGRQDTSRQSVPHPRYGMRVEGSSQQPSPVPPSTSVRSPLYSDSPSVHELHTLYVPPRPGWHASLFHSVGVPQSTDTLGFVESTVDDEITYAPRLSSPFVDSCVERGLVPTTWTDGQARQQARVWRTDLPQTTRGLGRIVGLSFFAPYSLFRSGQVSNESPTFTVSIWSGECRVSFSSFCSAVSIRSGRQLFFLFLGSLFTVSIWSVRVRARHTISVFGKERRTVSRAESCDSPASKRRDPNPQSALPLRKSEPLPFSVVFVHEISGTRPSSRPAPFTKHLLLLPFHEQDWSEPPVLVVHTRKAKLAPSLGPTSSLLPTPRLLRRAKTEPDFAACRPSPVQELEQPGSTPKSRHDEPIQAPVPTLLFARDGIVHLFGSHRPFAEPISQIPVQVSGQARQTFIPDLAVFSVPNAPSPIHSGSKVKDSILFYTLSVGKFSILLETINPTHLRHSDDVTSIFLSRMWLFPSFLQGSLSIVIHFWVMALGIPSFIFIGRKTRHIKTDCPNIKANPAKEKAEEKPSAKKGKKRL
ncbi:hypothetical protein M5K25_027606 [Dendrobium thyrsiflorum]|uniref:Uncharacterized protein n=1 Tax=Dendrobium thyrsiflorum TaxID=117978 RepID=A0ABD0TU90_DENTH